MFVRSWIHLRDGHAKRLAWPEVPRDNKATVKSDDEELRLAMIRLAKQYGRYGYRKIGHLLRMEGWTVNHKKIERLWREEGLQ
ncbi:MAG TPA: transposase [Rhodospirillales bacterium]|nr:transposase [Rhodospirillales bacterium]HIC59846.1 transposase [Rhodospirillales bacterium]